MKYYLRQFRRSLDKILFNPPLLEFIFLSIIFLFLVLTLWFE